MRGADLIVQSLAAAGVTRIFSLSGNQIMPIYDACLDQGIEIVHTRHEAAAAYMAEAYAQLTGSIGVALVTAGTGAVNALGPLSTARESETPLLLLSGDSPTSLDGTGAFQELDQVSMSAPLTKLSLRAQDPAALGEQLAVAVRAALTPRQGPVHIALPADVVEGPAGAGKAPSPSALILDRHPPDPEETRQIVDLLAKASRPVILCGPSLNRTRSGDLHDRLAAALDAPVVTMESPRGLRDPALGDIARVLAQADLVVSLGKRIDFTMGFGAQEIAPAKWICIDSEEREYDRARRALGDRLALAIAAAPRDAALALVAAGDTGNREGWRQEAAAMISARSFDREAPSERGAISPAQLCAAVQRQLDKSPDAVAICDGGEFGQWAQAVLDPRVRLINGVSGAIGGGLCYAIGAKRARPDAQVFSLMGDGTIGFHLAEFETAVRANTPFVAIIGNDQRWNAEHQIQLRKYGADRLIGCDLSDARYDLAVAALGGHGEFVTELADLEAALERAVASGKPACVNVMIEGLPAPAGSKAS